MLPKFWQEVLVHEGQDMSRDIKDKRFHFIVNEIEDSPSFS